MQLHDLLGETIDNGSRRMSHFLTTCCKALDALVPRLAGAKAQIDRLGRNSEADYLLRYALGVASHGDRPMLPSGYEVDLDRAYGLSRLQDSLRPMIEFGIDRFIGFATSTLGDIQPLRSEVRSVLALMSDVDHGFVEYGHLPGERESDADYQAARAMADAYLVIWHALPKVEALIDRCRAVFADRIKRQIHASNPHKYRPDHAAVERLFHASLYAAQIAKVGFSAEKPQERQGLGNFGDQSLISFTHDLKIAHDIMRALREVWMIVHGRLNRRQIASWLTSEKIDLKQASSYFTISSEPPDSIRNTIGLYRAYLGLTAIRSNPVLVNANDLIPLLRKLDIADIGIVSCDVRLDGREEYLHGEAEFRVPASRVVSPIRRIA